MIQKDLVRVFAIKTDGINSLNCTRYHRKFSNALLPHDAKQPYGEQPELGFDLWLRK